MSDVTIPEADVLERLKAACVGHPHAKIAWPHRLLHDAIAEIERLRAQAIRSSHD